MKVIFNPGNPDVQKPKYMHTNDAGADIFADRDIVIKKGGNSIPLNFECILPPGYAGFLTFRSSNMNMPVFCNMVPVDPDYSGTYHLRPFSLSDEDIVIKKGERFAQLTVLSFVQVEFVSREEYESNKRGSNGLGSTGK